jgi:CDP-diacylglycerol pyrophosphatase
MSRSRSYVLYIATFFLALAVIGIGARSASLFDASALEHALGRRDLWRVVNYLCVPSARIGAPFPCSEVHLGDDGGGWATLRVGSAHILTIPTKHVPGIESPAARSPESGNYWQAAWNARELVETDVGHKLPREAVGLAVNSAYARTQDQFHIHTSCVKPSVLAVLQSEQERIGSDWTRLHTALHGIHYMVRRLDASDLAGQNIVDLLPAAIKSNEVSLSRQALIVIGATFADGTEGYYVLNTQATPRGVGDGEALLNVGCR